MLIATKYDFSSNSPENEELEVEIPRICRHCHQTGEQSFLNATVLQRYSEDEDAEMLDTHFVVFTGCSYCGEVTQHYGIEHYIYGNCTYTFGKTIPEAKTDDIQIPENVSSISPDFKEIYNQSLDAEKNELTHLAGMGYRKSIEFLITDFLLAYPPEEVEKVWLKDPDTRLSEKINCLKNERLKKCPGL